MLSADTITTTDTAIGLNRYAYADDNPIEYTDPSGHDEVPSTQTDEQWAAQTWANDLYARGFGPASNVTYSAAPAETASQPPSPPIPTPTPTAIQAPQADAGTATANYAPSGGTPPTPQPDGGKSTSNADGGISTPNNGNPPQEMVTPTTQDHSLSAAEAFEYVQRNFLEPAAPFIPGEGVVAEGADYLLMSIRIGGKVEAVEAAGAAEEAGSDAARTLFHYTDEAGQKGILDSEQLNPSLRELNPSDARYGNGQYLSDIEPGTMTSNQLSRSFLGAPFWGSRFTNFVEIDVTGLNVVEGRAGVFVIPNEGPLDLTGRIVDWGPN